MPRKHKFEEIKKLIVEAKQNRETDRDVAARFHIGKSTVSDMYKRWREERTVKRKRGSGRPRKTTNRQDRLLVRLVKADPLKAENVKFPLWPVFLLATVGSKFY